MNRAKDHEEFCIVCNLPTWKRKWCKRHYSQQAQGYKPHRSVHELPTEEYLFSKCELDEETGCWNWLGADDGQYGYGNWSYKGLPRKTHRAAWVIRNGPIPVGDIVHHKCSNVKCCNPEHLQLASQADNMLEMLSRRALEARIAELEKENLSLRRKLQSYVRS